MLRRKIGPARVLLPRTEAIIFDIDGVLADSRQAVVKNTHRLLLQSGRRVGMEVVERAAKKGCSARTILLEAAPSLAQNEEELAHMVNMLAKLSVENVGSIKPTVLSGLVPALAREYALAIASNRLPSAAHAILERLGIAAFFEAVMTIGDAPPKPAPDMIRLALVRLEVPAASAVFVGDKPSDRRAGEAAGVRTIMVDACRGTDGCLGFIREFGKEGVKQWK
jgi:beta-phosphoglucomutase-like phosphatase (HAD superfamily)